MNKRFIRHVAFIAAILWRLRLPGPLRRRFLPPLWRRPRHPIKAPNADGFIQRWLLLEPIAANELTEGAVQALVKKEHFPNQFTVMPQDGEKVIVGGAELTWHAVDTTNYNVNLFHFARAQGKKTSDVLFWAVTIINCPREMRDVRLSIGSNAASVWWVNGKEVIGIYGDRQTVIDDGVSKRLTLNQGPNVVRAAIVNGGGATDFCARFLDAEDKPLKEITVSLGAVRAMPSTLGYKVSETKLPATSTGNLSVQNDPDWTKPFPPFKIAGNLYYVGSKGLANYLITTPQGHILINSDLEANVPLIRASVEKLGFKFTDIKILLISHAHWDHDAGERHDQEADRREVHGDGRRRAGRRIGRQDGFSVWQRPPASTRRQKSIACCTTAMRSSSAARCSWRISLPDTRRVARRGR